ncbi:DUF1127 domain-containing protein [Seohaeicola zhoushanensis]|uniref:YjiS-like domain-containing protein n=1 Tax=Seohaeicola zhoushanensis TaxID=1569283 RepID=A0A8J3GXN6_9RHOB|nr:DUF1127 domain-containing protein [Seohaeicola zhoushanensis]GHF54589.1 hypothetical protein GCM10017056_27570 [Seohaeicola zhoushanensis]
MTTKAQTTARINPTLQIDSSRPFLLRLLDALVAWDARHRDAHKLRNMTDERLADMGMTRSDAENAFRR